LANFIGEFLVLFGSYSAQPFMTILASLGMVMAAVYSLAMMQRTFFGQQRETRIAPDLSNTAFGTLLLIAALQVWLGLYPRPVLTTTRPVMEMLVRPTLASLNPNRPPSESLSSSDIFTSHASAP
jgi:NADH-quinone oxidoreductase subunit M